MSERRAHVRRKIIVPVRVTLSREATSTDDIRPPDAVQFAHTLDIHCAGLRIGHIHAELPVGQIVTLSRGIHKAKFRVMWSRRVGSHEVQAGLAALQQSQRLLGIDLTEREPDATDRLMALLMLPTTRAKNSAK